MLVMVPAMPRGACTARQALGRKFPTGALQGNVPCLVAPNQQVAGTHPKRQTLHKLMRRYVELNQLHQSRLQKRIMGGRLSRQTPPYTQSGAAQAAAQFAIIC